MICFRFALLIRHIFIQFRVKKYFMINIKVFKKNNKYANIDENIEY